MRSDGEDVDGARVCDAPDLLAVVFSVLFYSKKKNALD
jgi:hypothetical protein